MKLTIYSPAGVVLNAPALRLACRRLRALGFDAALDESFLKGASAAGLKTLKGHRSVGGMRASIYNAISEEAVGVLIDYMREFQRSHG